MNIQGYTLLEHQILPELSSEGYIWKHETSGARVFYLRNPKDSNKVFCISFCTPPEDDCGIPHILEHSVLCGSDKFPLKDPFIQLAKGSLNTFLNAMTYPDKTMYPVASENDQDFLNLMDVYMNAVFFPNILKDPRILMQEGWHHEITDDLSQLSIKGVVYNEMKGAFSSPEDVLFADIKKHLYPDTPYTYESGGDPKAIPDLTYERFLDFYNAHYSSSNSYIFIYGNGDMEQHLTWLHEQYLQHMEDSGSSYSIPNQPAFAAPKTLQGTYSVTSGEDTTDKAYLSYNTVYGQVTDPILYYASDILEYMLLETEGAPLKKALVERNMGEDIFGYNDNSLKQPTFGVVVKNADPARTEEFRAIVMDTCKDIVEKGWSREMLDGALNRFEFRLREGDYGSSPTGLIYGITAMDSWLHGENPMTLLHFDSIFTELRKRAAEGYFEELLQKMIIENPHALVYTLVPEPGMSVRIDQEKQQELDTYLASLTEEEKLHLKAAKEDLLKHQQEEETEEALNSVPILSLSDIPREREKYPYDVYSLSGNEALRYHGATNGIVYLKLLFPMEHITAEDLPYVSLLCDILGSVDTSKYTYEQLGNAVNFHTGGIGMSIHTAEQSLDSYTPFFKIIGKCLYKEYPAMLELIREQLLESDLSDKNRMRELIAESCSRLEMRIMNNGHSVAVSRAMAGFSRSAAFKEHIKGLKYYEVLKNINDHFEDCFEDLKDTLMRLIQSVFRRNGLLIHFTHEESVDPQMDAETVSWLETIPSATTDANTNTTVIEYMPENLGLLSSSQVQYVACAGSFTEEYCGSMQVLRSILSLDYLWNQVRVVGGAYGCMTGVNRLKLWYIVSYRDPNLKETFDVYERATEYVENFNASRREMDKYIIGTISNLSQPMSVSMKGALTLDMYLNHVTDADMQKVREEVLETTPEDIRRLAAPLKEALTSGHICVYGNEEKIRKHADLFDRLQELV